MDKKDFIISSNGLVACYNGDEDLTIHELGELRAKGWKLTGATNDSYCRFCPEYYFEKVKKKKGKGK